jgi:hypothetical protein
MFGFKMAGTQGHSDEGAILSAGAISVKKKLIAKKAKRGARTRGKRRMRMWHQITGGRRWMQESFGYAFGDGRRRGLECALPRLAGLAGLFMFWQAFGWRSGYRASWSWRFLM